jgi:hypothetical protein
MSHIVGTFTFLQSSQDGQGGWSRCLAVLTDLELDYNHPDYSEDAVADLMRKATRLQTDGAYHACSISSVGALNA